MLYSGMGAAGARLIRPLEWAGTACKMMLSSPRIVRVFPVPGGPCSSDSHTLEASFLALPSQHPFAMCTGCAC